MKQERVVFAASFPDLKSAISISGAGDSRIKLDIPQSEIAEVVKLTLCGQKLLKVTVEVVDDGEDFPPKTNG